MGRSVLPLSLVLLFGCEKITVLECDGSVHDGAVNLDTGVKPDSGDAGVGMDVPDMPDAGDMDAGDPDTGEMDSGMTGCAGAPYCLDALMPDADLVNVREMVIFTPMVTNPNGETLTFSGEASEIVAERRTGLPDADLSDLELNLTVNPTTGETSLTITEVPTWFSTTTFVVSVHAQSAAGPDVVGEGRVTVRGNVVVSGFSEVYAIASDGRPALSVNFTGGRLLDGASFVDGPQELVMSRSGTLLVYDQGATPPRIRRFALDGENSHLGDLQVEDGGNPVISVDHGGLGMTELSDGRVALVDYEFSRAQESMVHIWNADFTYSHTINAPLPDTRWSGLAADDTGKLFVLERESNGRLLEIDPATGQEIAVLATDISFGQNVARMPDGHFYVGLGGTMLRVTPTGGKQMVSGLPNSSTAYTHLWPYGETHVVAARSLSSMSFNVVLIEETDFVRYQRLEGVGPTFTPAGIAYLE